MTAEKLELLQRNYAFFLDYESKALADYSALQVINEKSLKETDVVKACLFRPMNVRNLPPGRETDERLAQPFKCDRIKQPLPSIYIGRKCFTYFSDIFDMKPEWVQYRPQFVKPVEDVSGINGSLSPFGGDRFQYQSVLSNETKIRRGYKVC